MYTERNIIEFIRFEISISQAIPEFVSPVSTVSFSSCFQIFNIVFVEMKLNFNIIEIKL